MPPQFLHADPLPQPSSLRPWPPPLPPLPPPAKRPSSPASTRSSAPPAPSRSRFNSPPTKPASGAPISKPEEDTPTVKRGNALKSKLLTPPLPPMHPARVVTPDAKKPLQSGWIARAPNNRLIVGPGDIQLVRDTQGNLVPGATKS